MCHYQTIDTFFDTFDLPSSTKLLQKLIITADAEKTWKGVPADALCFTSRLEDLITAVFELVQQYNYQDEVIIQDEQREETWMLTVYETYCGWHTGKTPWDFFPRHLSKKEFLNPNRVLDKFTGYKTLSEWKYLLNDLLSHALSHERITEFDTGNNLLVSAQLLHKLLEATHLIEVRQSTPQPKPRSKWKSPTNNP